MDRPIPLRPNGSADVAQRHDVSGRLAEGREAVTHLQTYVAACQRRGYRHPELTGYEGQLADHYDSEAGLDLRALDADCVGMYALADAADEALRAQRQQLVELDGAWRGPGADVAAEFLRQHCDAAAQLTARLRAVAGACGSLRDELWRLVDAKVAAVLAVDERAGAYRSSWLAAAHAVASGSEDERATEVVDKQVLPYVDNDVRVEWVAAVRSARDGIDAAYGAAVAAAEPGPSVVFALPGDLGPVGQPAAAEPVVPFSVAPMPGLAEVPPAQPAAVAPGPPGPAVGDPAPAGPLDALPGDLGSLGVPGLPGDLGLPSTGLPGGAGGGLGGLAGLGGLIPRLIDALGDPGAGQALDEPFDEHARGDPEPEDPAGPTDSEDAGDSEPAGQTAGAAEEPEPAELSEDIGPRPGAEETADTEDADQPGEADDPPGPAADVAPKTPCETAAEELPQVGE